MSELKDFSESLGTAVLPFSRVLIRAISAKTTTESGLAIPESEVQKQRDARGTIVRVGKECKYVKEGQLVAFHKNLLDNIITVGGEELILINENNVLVFFEEN